MCIYNGTYKIGSVLLVAPKSLTYGGLVLVFLCFPPLPSSPLASPPTLSLPFILLEGNSVAGLREDSNCQLSMGWRPEWIFCADFALPSWDSLNVLQPFAELTRFFKKIAC